VTTESPDNQDLPEAADPVAETAAEPTPEPAGEAVEVVEDAGPVEMQPAARARTRVKICGITRVEDAQLAVQNNVWALGMIMWPASPRYVAPQAAADIADSARKSAEIVGVFVDQPLDEVVALISEIGLSMVQLHGNEGKHFCQAIVERTGVRVIKAFRVQGRDVLGEMGKFYGVDFHLLDTYKAGIPGGTGETFDWKFLVDTPRRGDVPLILSGGLTPENVAGAIEMVGPYAVDVSSGVESEPGIKDHDKMNAFFAAVDGSVSPRHAVPDSPLTGVDDEVLTLAYHRRIAAEEALAESRADSREPSRPPRDR
jgi:phosphoribosylanthranilate isomerase